MAILSCAVGLGCGQGDRSDAGDAAGNVRIALSLPGGITVNAVAWQVVSATNQVLASGVTDTSNPSASPSVSFSVPPGMGDTVLMSATTTTGASCTGQSEPFNVLAGQMVPIVVRITCGSSPGQPGLGTVTVTGVLVAGDECPVVKAWSISPQQTAAGGGLVDVMVVASDADVGETLSYAWSATQGSFVDDAVPTTQYICGPAGDQTLSLKITDNHTPISCALDLSFPIVTCL